MQVTISWDEEKEDFATMDTGLFDIDILSKEDLSDEMKARCPEIAKFAIVLDFYHTPFHYNRKIVIGWESTMEKAKLLAEVLIFSAFRRFLGPPNPRKEEKD